MKRMTIAVDLAKNVFEIAVSHQPGRVYERHRISRAKFLLFFAKREPSTIILEATGSAHHWARELERFEHTVVLLPPHDVRAYVRRNKTDRADAKALLEAYRNEDIHPVPIKTVGQQSMAAMHRLRSAWVGARTARINGVRGVLRELGVVIPVGARNVVPRVRELICEGSLPTALAALLEDACEEIRQLERRTHSVELQLKALAEQMPSVSRLRTVPGVGLLTATAIVAFAGDIRRFRSGRHFASYLGLTPREHSSGNVRRLGSISKRGDVYLRTLLIQCARAVLWRCTKDEKPRELRAWTLRVAKRRGSNKAVVALANKLARIVWATTTRETEFRPRLPNVA